MTIRKGESWGEPMGLPEGSPVVDSDFELATTIQRTIGAHSLPTLVEGLRDHQIVLGVTGGDLHRTLGSPRHDESAMRSGAAMGFPIDLGVVEIGAPEDPSLHIFAAHLIATTTQRGDLWRGRTVIVMNAAFREDQNLAPRGHPNDGRLDMTDGELGFTDRRRALGRTPSGSHVPHPDLLESRPKVTEVSADKPMWVRCDGILIGRSRWMRITCIPDALTIIV